MNLKVILIFIAFILTVIGAVLATLTDNPDGLTLWGLLHGALACYFGSLLVPADVKVRG